MFYARNGLQFLRNSRLGNAFFTFTDSTGALRSARASKLSNGVTGYINNFQFGISEWFKHSTGTSTAVYSTDRMTLDRGNMGSAMVYVKFNAVVGSTYSIRVVKSGFSIVNVGTNVNNSSNFSGGNNGASIDSTFVATAELLYLTISNNQPTPASILEVEISAV